MKTASNTIQIALQKKAYELYQYSQNQYWDITPTMHKKINDLLKRANAMRENWNDTPEIKAITVITEIDKILPQ